MDKLKYVKLENEDGTYSSPIPLAVDSNYVDVNGNTLTEELNSKATKTETTNLANDINTQKTRIDNLSTLTEGSTTGDAELIDGRTDYESVSHVNIGDAIRNSNNNLHTIYAEDLDIKNEIAATEIGTVQNGYGITSNGARGGLPGSFVNRYNVNGYKYVHIQGHAKSVSSSYGLYAFYAGNDWSSYMANTVYIVNGTTSYGYWNLIVKVPTGAKSIQVTNSDSEHPLIVKVINYKRYVDDYNTIDNLPNLYISNKDLFYIPGKISKTDGRSDTSFNNDSTYCITPYIKIDKTNNIVLYKGYETGSAGPLCLYDKDLNFIRHYGSGSAAVRDITIAAADIPEDACYMRAQGRINYELNKYISNGELNYGRLNMAEQIYDRFTDEKLYEGTLFFIEHKGLWKTNDKNKGKEGTTDANNYCITPYIKIDKTSDIVLVKGYETTSNYGPLFLYDKDLNVVWESTYAGATSNRDITIAAADIPENAYYMRAFAKIVESGKKITNGIMTYGRLNEIYDIYNNKANKALPLNNLFYIEDVGLDKRAGIKYGKEIKPFNNYCITPYIKIDKTSDIVLTGGYETSSTCGPLFLYDKDLNCIADYSTGTAGGKNVTVAIADIPENAYYMRAFSQKNQVNQNLTNGEITFERLNIVDAQASYGYYNDIGKYLYQSQSYFYVPGTFKKVTGEDADYEGYFRTPYIKIDKTSDIIIQRAYETSTAYSPFCVYDENLNIVHDYSTGNGGLKDFDIAAANIPENAYYFRVAGRQIDANKYIENGEMTFDRLNSIDELKIKNLTTELTELKDKYAHDVMATKYTNVITSRENYLRQLYKASGEAPRWYGAEWEEVTNGNDVIGIYSEGDSYLLETLPIQNLMRRCIYKNHEVVYYLDADNSELKEDGTVAKLDGTDGNVMVEIPEFFYKVETITNNGVRKIRVKISQQGLDGFLFSPKMYVAAYESTVDHTTERLVSVCTTVFTRNEEEVKISAENNYIVGTGYSLGTQKTAIRSGFTDNAAQYRGGTNDSNLDQYTDPTNSNFCRNQLGLPVSFLTRQQCKNLTNPLDGELIYQYDVHKILFYLSMIEYRNRIIQNTSLGKGATVYPSYDAYEFFFKDSAGKGQGGLACLPCGITNSLGNHSGEVYYLMPQVPVTCSERSSSAVYTFDDVWMPCMSYRGIEHYYGHLYKVTDQITVTSKETEEVNPLISNKHLYNVSYYYQKNPFMTDDDIYNSTLLWSGIFTPNICCISQILGGPEGHVLPILTSNSSYTYNYGECAEYDSSGDPTYMTVNGRIVSGTLVGRNFIVAVFKKGWTSGRANDGTRLMYYDGVK